MAKQEKTAMVQPVPVAPELEEATPEAIKKVIDQLQPVPRQRGTGPVCPQCGSGMTCNGSFPMRTGNHPLKRVKYFACKSQKCGFTCKGAD